MSESGSEAKATRMAVIVGSGPKGDQQAPPMKAQRSSASQFKVAYAPKLINTLFTRITRRWRANGPLRRLTRLASALAAHQCITSEPRWILTKRAKPITASKFDVLTGQLTDLGNKYIEDKDYISAQLTFRKLLPLNSKDVNARFIYAHLIEDGTHKKHAEARDLLLSILDDHPEILSKSDRRQSEPDQGSGTKVQQYRPQRQGHRIASQAGPLVEAGRRLFSSQRGSHAVQFF